MIKTATITYPNECTLPAYNCSYSKNENETESSVNVKTTTQSVEFTLGGSVQAIVKVNGNNLISITQNISGEHNCRIQSKKDDMKLLRSEVYEHGNLNVAAYGTINCWKGDMVITPKKEGSNIYYRISSPYHDSYDSTKSHALSLCKTSYSSITDNSCVSHRTHQEQYAHGLGNTNHIANIEAVSSTSSENFEWYFDNCEISGSIYYCNLKNKTVAVIAFAFALSLAVNSKSFAAEENPAATPENAAPSSVVENATNAVGKNAQNASNSAADTMQNISEQEAAALADIAKLNSEIQQVSDELKDMDIETISEITNLSVKEIEEIKNNKRH